MTMLQLPFPVLAAKSRHPNFESDDRQFGEHDLRSIGNMQINPVVLFLSCSKFSNIY